MDARRQWPRFPQERALDDRAAIGAHLAPGARRLEFVLRAIKLDHDRAGERASGRNPRRASRLWIPVIGRANRLLVRLATRLLIRIERRATRPRLVIGSANANCSSGVASRGSSVERREWRIENRESRIENRKLEIEFATEIDSRRPSRGPSSEATFDGRTGGRRDWVFTNSHCSRHCAARVQRHCTRVTWRSRPGDRSRMKTSRTRVESNRIKRDETRGIELRDLK